MAPLGLLYTASPLSYHCIQYLVRWKRNVSQISPLLPSGYAKIPMNPVGTRRSGILGGWILAIKE